MSKTYSAGIVTAYGAAKRAGYQGTYEDFCRQQAGYAESAAAVEQAKNTAVSAANTATTKAGEAATAATAAQTAKTQTEQTASQALTDISTARSGAISAVQTEGSTQTANARSQAQAAAQSATTASTKASEASASATSAGQSATNAAASATSAANAASAAQGVLESIPEDYSDLSEDVDQLKADLQDESKSKTKAIDESMVFTLISPATTTGGWKIAASGNAARDNSYQIDKYSVTAGDLLRVKLTKDGDVVYTFSQDSSISSSQLVGSPKTNAVDGYIVVPESATYLMVSKLRTNNVDFIKSCASVAVNLTALVAATNNEIDSVESIIYDNLIDAVEPINLFNKNAEGITTGYYLGPSVTEGSQYSISDYIPVVNGKSYSWYSDANSLICMYDSSQNYLGYVSGTQLATHKFTGAINNSNCTLARFSYKTAAKDTVMFVEGSTYPETYHAYISEAYYSVKGSIAENPLYGKKIGVLGDSIMYGEGFSGGAVGIIASRNSMEMCNVAVSGAKITITGSTACIYNQLANLDNDCDYIIFDGGVNDMTDNNLGVITTGFSATYDESTFSGSFEKLIHDIVSTYPTKKIGYVSVHRLKQWEGDSYSSYSNTGYYERALEILKKWGIPVCDLTKNTLSLYENSQLKSLYTLNGDGWHPNENGYKFFYCDKIEAWLKTI